MTQTWGTWRAGRRLLASLLVVPMLALTACGDDDDNAASETTASQTSPTTAAADAAATTGGSDSTAAADATTTAAGDEADDVDPDGVLKVNWELNTPPLALDPIKANAPTESWIYYMIYDTLLRQNADGSYEPGLAEVAEVVDPSTISVTLKPGLTFSDGSPLDAEAAKASILRIKDSNQVRAFRMAELAQLADIEVTSPTEFTLHLAAPIAGSFYNLLAHNETLVVSPAGAQADTLNDNPVGAGPFRVTERTDQVLKLEKWDGFHDADKVRLAGVEVISIGTDNQPALANGLLSGAVDASPVPFDLVAQLGGNVETETEVNPDAVIWVSMQCQAFPVLQDVRIRQALNFATDKDALNQALTGGQGEPMSQFGGSGNDYYDDSISDAYDYDPDRARQLLQEAGQPDLHLTMSVSQAGGPTLRTAEVLQQQWQEVGVTLEIVPTTNALEDYYLGKKTMLFPTLQSRFWTDKITRNFVPGSTGNTCDPQNSEFTADVAALQSLDRETPEAVEVWKETQRFLSEGAYGIFGIINTQSRAWNPDRVGNPTWRPTQLGIGYPDALKVYIKQ